MGESLCPILETVPQHAVYCLVVLCSDERGFLSSPVTSSGDDTRCSAALAEETGSRVLIRTCSLIYSETCIKLHHVSTWFSPAHNAFSNWMRAMV